MKRYTRKLRRKGGMSGLALALPPGSLPGHPCEANGYCKVGHAMGITPMGYFLTCAAIAGMVVLLKAR